MIRSSRENENENEKCTGLEPSSFARLKASLPLLILGASSPPLAPLDPFDRIRGSLTSLRGVDTIVTLCFRSVFCMSLSLSTVKVQSMPPHVLGSCFRSEISSPWILSRFDAHPALLSPPLCGPIIRSLIRVESIYTTRLARGTSLFLAWFCTRAKLTLLSSLQIRSSTFGSNFSLYTTSERPKVISASLRPLPFSSYLTSFFRISLLNMPDPRSSMTVSAQIQFQGHHVPIEVPMGSIPRLRCTITPDVYSSQDVPKPLGTFKLRVYLRNAKPDQAALVSTWYNVTGNLRWEGNSEEIARWTWKNPFLEILNGPVEDDLVWVSKAYMLRFGKNEGGQSLFDVEINLEPIGLFAQQLLAFYTQSSIRPRHRKALKQQIKEEKGEGQAEEEEKEANRGGRAAAESPEQETKPAKKRRVTTASE